MNWESITASISQGGLGILDLGDMNKVLAATWIFRFANDKDSLWRKVVCAKSNGGPDRLMLALGNHNNNSVLLGFVESSIGRNGHVRDVVNKQFKILIGDGQDIDFSYDD